MDTFRTRSTLVALVVLTSAAITLASCGDDAESPPAVTGAAPDLASLEPLISCGDAVFAFASPDDGTLVYIDIPGLLAEVEGADGAFTRTYDLGATDATARATLEVGTALGTSACNDVIDPAHEVTASWETSGGTATVSISDVPAGPLEVCATGVDASLAVDGVTFVVDGETITMPTLTLDSAIGWCPG